MKKNMLFLLIAAGVLLTWAITSPAAESSSDGEEKQAFFLKTGQDLVDLCSLAEDHPLHDKAVAFCYGYVTGAMSFYGAIAEAPGMPKVICVDRVIPRSEMVDVFLGWAKTNKKHLTEPPIDALVRSAVAQWPCDKK